MDDKQREMDVCEGLKDIFAWASVIAALSVVIVPIVRQAWLFAAEWSSAQASLVAVLTTGLIAVGIFQGDVQYRRKGRLNELEKKADQEKRRQDNLLRLLDAAVREVAYEIMMVGELLRTTLEEHEAFVDDQGRECRLFAPKDISMLLNEGSIIQDILLRLSDVSSGVYRITLTAVGMRQSLASSLARCEGVELPSQPAPRGAYLYVLHALVDNYYTRADLGERACYTALSAIAEELGEERPPEAFRREMRRLLSREQ